MKYKINFDLNLEGAKLPQFVENVKGHLKTDIEVEMSVEEFFESTKTIKELATFVAKEFKEINQENVKRSSIIEDLSKKNSENIELRLEKEKLKREVRELKDKVKKLEDKDDDDPLI